MKKIIVIGISTLILLLLLSGCTQQTTQTQPQEQALPQHDPNDDLETSIEKMTDFMEKEGGDKEVSTVPIPEEQDFSGSMQRQGEFINVNYMTTGTVTLEEKDGKTFVVFGENFSTPNGPDLVVYLTKNSAKTTRQDISDGIELGELKSTKGKQTYEITGDASQYNSVSIHCKAFNVPWSYAPLN